MSRVFQSLSGRLRVGFVIALAVLTSFACIGVGRAEAASSRYCSGCTIYSNSLVQAGTARYITLDYVHRLSGPSSGVTIGAIARYADNGAWGNYVFSTSTQVTHGYSGSRRAWGAAANFGAGNYGFNAHVNY